MNLEEIATKLTEIVPSLLGPIIAFLLYRLNREIRRDRWAQELRDFHQFFWTNPDCEKVRIWLACDASYESIRPILQRRLKNEYILEKEYKTLETLDKFFALLAMYRRIEIKDGKHMAWTRRAFDEYWLGCLTSTKRPELRDYVHRFYKELRNSLP